MAGGAAGGVRGADEQQVNTASVGITLVMTTVIGLAGGYYADRWLGTAPLLMVVFLGLGATAGIMNVVRTAKRMQADAASLKDLPSVPDDDD